MSLNIGPHDSDCRCARCESRRHTAKPPNTFAPGEFCLCGHIYDEHFGGCSRVGCSCREFATLEAARDIYEALNELLSACADGIRRYHAGDPKAIMSNLISATMIQAEAAIRKAKGE
jgi:hypothetical protein